MAPQGFFAGLVAAGVAAGLSLGLPAPAAGTETPKAPSERPSDTVATKVVVERIGDGPLIYPGMPGLEGELGNNINGPAVIKVPSWVENPLGKYYMYFAHHRGTYIRLAYADDPRGPWTIYEPGTLRLEQTSAIHHIASPDVIVDEANKQIMMYFHGPTEQPGGDYGGRPYQQRTFVASSKDGLAFTAVSGAATTPYIRMFRYRGAVYGLGMADKVTAYPLWLRSGQFSRSVDGLPPFESGPRILDEMRHSGLVQIGDDLHVFYTMVGDMPERIFYSKVDLRPDWSEWTASSPIEVLRPTGTAEGEDLPLTASRGGMVTDRERALRDPAVLDDDGQIYLYYTVAGEKGIAVAKVSFK
ncbi:conserved hypothetical protein [Altererythrobacter sp. B11]|uniref:hypothetical protein n=1 Tax=Altererythrobacter sp. B11 TaxID=2060312 RepID=UPI000DC74296|nr:hypothetical protein [Altererythrobacter sp. B11]BBC73377.1 conserved hypothetical protein [Altererythrobacter sp. B11]